MVTMEEYRKAQRAEGPTTIMAIGTSTPSNCVDQSTYPDYYFRITNSEHMTKLKEKFKRISAPHMFINGYKNVLAIAVETDYDYPLAQQVKEYLKDPCKFALASAAVVESNATSSQSVIHTNDKKEEEVEAESEEDDAMFGLFDE